MVGEVDAIDADADADADDRRTVVMMTGEIGEIGLFADGELEEAALTMHCKNLKKKNGVIGCC